MAHYHSRFAIKLSLRFNSIFASGPGPLRSECDLHSNAPVYSCMKYGILSEWLICGYPHRWCNRTIIVRSMIPGRIYMLGDTVPNECHGLYTTFSSRLCSFESGVIFAVVSHGMRSSVFRVPQRAVPVVIGATDSTIYWVPERILPMAFRQLR